MTDLPIDFNGLLLIAVPLLVQAIKSKLAGAPKWVAPLLAIGLGLGGNLLYQWIESLVTGGQLDAGTASLVGALLGAASTALYSVVKEGARGERFGNERGPELTEPRGGLGL